MKGLVDPCAAVRAAQLAALLLLMGQGCAADPDRPESSADEGGGALQGEATTLRDIAARGDAPTITHHQAMVLDILYREARA